MWIIEVAEVSRIDGSLEGGFCYVGETKEEMLQAVKELEEEIQAEVLDDDNPFNSLKWHIDENANIESEDLEHFQRV